jgi:hypothetical protein
VKARRVMALWPPELTARGWGDVAAVVAWVGASDVAMEAVQAATGDWNNHLRNAALLPREVIHNALGAARIALPPAGQVQPPPRQLTPLEASQVGLVWRIARRLSVGDWGAYIDDDPAVAARQAPPPQAPQGGQGGLHGGPALRLIKFKEVIDQADPTEVEPATARQIQTWHQNFAAWALGEPEDDETPVEDQLTALNHRVNNQLRSPYVDFAVWGPFARKLIRAMQFRAWVPQSDGTFLAREISGPKDYNCWLPLWACSPSRHT